MKKLMLCALLFFTYSSSILAHDLSWDNLMLASVKLQSNFDYEANVTSYMKLYRPDVWKKYRNDEFMFHDKKQETIEIMKKNFASFSLDEEFVTYTTLKFEDYDFSNEEFPVKSLSETTYFSKSIWRSGSFPKTYKVFLTNPDKVKNLSMPKDRAREFLQSRKSKVTGRVNRKVYLRLKFKVKSLKNGKDELLAEITEAKFYKDNEFSEVLQEF